MTRILSAEDIDRINPMPEELRIALLRTKGVNGFIRSAIIGNHRAQRRAAERAKRAAAILSQG